MGNLVAPGSAGMVRNTLLECERFSSTEETQIATAARPENLSVDEAIARLTAGNQRYMKDLALNLHADSKRRQELISGQLPFVTIITCADSRVPERGSVRTACSGC